MPHFLKNWRPERLLIIRFSAIGDVIMTTALIRQLKQSFPEAQIDFLVKSAYIELLQNNPHLNTVYGYESVRQQEQLIQRLKKNRYDGLIDLQSSLRSRFFVFRIRAKRQTKIRIGRLKRFCLVQLHWDLYRSIRSVPEKYLDTIKSWGGVDDGQGLELKYRPIADLTVDRLLSAFDVPDNKPLLLIAPGAGRKTKHWLPERFAELGRYFANQGFFIIQIGGSADADICEAVTRAAGESILQVCGQLRLEETAALMSRAKLLVTNDSGMMHMATAVKVPVVAIFGPTTRHFGFFPFRSVFQIVESDLNCRPCSFHGTDSCPKGHFKCMREIKTASVIQACEKLLELGRE